MTRRMAIGKASTTGRLAAAACSMLAALAASTFASAQSVRGGADAFGDWRTDAPGVIRQIAIRN